MSTELARFRQSPTALHRDLDDELIVAVPDRPDFNSLTGSARVVWDLLDAPRTPTDLVALASALYERSPHSIAPDVGALLADLIERGLVEEVTEKDG